MKKWMKNIKQNKEKRYNKKIQNGKEKAKKNF